VDCGDGGPLVESCTDCPDGDGAAGCKGDCVYDTEFPICRDNKEDPKVDCGDHDAPACGQCDATSVLTIRLDVPESVSGTLPPTLASTMIM